MNDDQKRALAGVAMVLDNPSTEQAKQAALQLVRAAFSPFETTPAKKNLADSQISRAYVQHQEDGRLIIEAFVDELPVEVGEMVDVIIKKR